jgi:hypothetical protein
MLAPPVRSDVQAFAPRCFAAPCCARIAGGLHLIPVGLALRVVADRHRIELA